MPPVSDKRHAQEDVLAIYRRHPQREQRILERLRRQRGTLEGITELDLARDNVTGITDQNHVGGLRFVKELAERACVPPSARILDLGCGLGGSSRVLAHLYDCRVYGVDLSQQRCREANRLTRRVGLEGKVCARCGDFLTMPVPADEAFDVLWGQSAWSHVAAKSHLIGRWVPALRRHGRIAFEEAYLKRPPHGGSARLLSELEDCWKSYLVGLDDWLECLPQGYSVDVVEDLSYGFVRNFTRLLKIAEGPGRGRYNATEVAGWEHALELADAGVVGYIRIVATKPG